VNATAPTDVEIQLRRVTKIFGDSDSGAVVALDGIDLDVAKREFVCLLGPSGCGKSTLLNAVAGFVLPTSGEIIAAGGRVTRPGSDRGMVCQE
jgi:NitT/TauT family transport system ATP-binding protein